MKNTKKGLFLVIISGIVFGIMPSAVTFCYSKGVDKLLVLMFRYLGLAIVLLPSVLKQKNIFTFYTKNFFKLFWLSLAGVSTPLLLYSAYSLLPTGVVTTVHFLYPTIVALMCIVIFREKLSKLKGICLALCVIGMFLMLDTSGQKLNPAGLIIAIASAFTWSVYIILLDKLDFSGASSAQIMFCVGINGVALSAIAALFSGISLAVPPIGWISLVGVSMFISVFGVLFFASGVRETDAQVSAIASTLEPITSIFVGVVFLKEKITPLTAIGAVMILAAVILLSLYGNRSAD